MPDVVAGLDSAVMFGKGEPGSNQPNEFAGELQNWWIRCDRIVDSYTPPVVFTPTDPDYFEIYGRFDFRFNGNDSVLYAAIYNNAGEHRIDNLLDFSLGRFQQIHFDPISSDDPNRGVWYLSSGDDQRFVSSSVKDVSFWMYDGITEDAEWSYICHYMKWALSNVDGTVFAQTSVADGSFWVFNDNVGSDSWYFITHYMKHVISNQAETVFSQTNVSDGSIWMYNLSYEWLMQLGKISVAKLDSTTYASLNAVDGSIYAFNASNDSFKYLEKSLKLFNQDGTPTGYCELGFNSSGDGSYLQLGSGVYRGEIHAGDHTNGDLSLTVANVSTGKGLFYQSSTDSIGVTGASGANGYLYPYQLVIDDGTNTGTYEPNEITLTSGGATVFINAGDISGGTASFQQVTLCVGGVSKTAYFLMTTPQ